MSFLDRLKSLFSGGSREHDHSDHAGHSHDEPHGGESGLEASLGVPPAVDPLGTQTPEAAPIPPSPPPATDTDDKA